MNDQNLFSHNNSLADTARWTAAARARESSRSDRLFYDPLAEILAGEDGFSLLAKFDTPHSPVGGNPFLPIRTRWFDEVITEAVRKGIRQVVALAAGLDTRAFRLDWPDGTVMFEMDQEELLRHKQAKLEEGNTRPRCDRRVVYADLAGDWQESLLTAGYDVGRPTAWFAEGLLFYLRGDTAAALLQKAAGISLPRSRLAVDLIGTGIFRLPYMKDYLGKLAQAGSPWRFGTDEPSDFVEGCGWLVREAVEPGDPSANFGRWPALRVPDRLTLLPRSYLVTATRPA